jgi:hypothetical protein
MSKSPIEYFAINATISGIIYFFGKLDLLGIFKNNN